MPTANAILNEYDARIADIRTTYADRRGALLTDIDQTSARLSELRNDLSGLDARIQADVDAARSDVYDALHVKLDPTGTPVPRQGAPRGPRQRPASAGDPPLAMHAGNEPDAKPSAYDEFRADLSDRAPAAELEALGWTDGGEGLSDVQTRTLVKHQITPDEVTSFLFNGVIVRGTTWTMDDAARVVA